MRSTLGPGGNAAKGALRHAAAVQAPPGAGRRSESVERYAAADPGAVPRNRVDRQRAADRLDAVLHVAQPAGRASAGRGEAGPVVADLEGEGTVLAEGQPRRARARRVLVGVLQRLDAGEVDGRLDL